MFAILTNALYKAAVSALLSVAVLSFPGSPAASQATEQGTAIKEVRAGNRGLSAWRVTYTVTESDAGKLVGTQHYSMTVIANGHASVLKQGTKNPLLTGGYLHENAPETTQFQFTYIDTGLNLSALLTEDAAGLQLSAKVEQSVLVDAVNPQTMRDPSVRQNVLECSSIVRPGLPIVIGAYDVPGSSHRWQVEAVVERIP